LQIGPDPGQIPLLPDGPFETDEESSAISSKYRPLIVSLRLRVKYVIAMIRVLRPAG